MPVIQFEPFLPLLKFDHKKILPPPKRRKEISRYHSCSCIRSCMRLYRYGPTADILLSANGQASGVPYFLEPGFQAAALRPVQLLLPCTLTPAGRSLKGFRSLLLLFVAFLLWN